MTRTPAILAALLMLAALPALPAGAHNPCPDQPVHFYHAFVPGKNRAMSALDESGWAGFVVVSDTNVADCNPIDGVPGDWDGDYDVGVGGAAFGYGSWIDDPDCGYQLNHHGGNVVVNDAVFGSNIWFMTGEDDQSGPVKIQDPVTLEYTCTTSGSIMPGDPATDPTADADDCLSGLFVGVGFTCGSGGGDGLFWVFFPYMADCSSGECRVNPNSAPGLASNVVLGNPATTGTIAAF